MQTFGTPGEYELNRHGLSNLGKVYWDLSPAALIEQSVLRGEAQISAEGAVVATTGQHTGRSPKDKFVAKYPDVEHETIWWGNVNQPLSPEKFDLIHERIAAYLQNRDVFVQNLFVGAHPDYQMPIRIITERAWHSLFAHDLFIRPAKEQIAGKVPEFTVIACPGFTAEPETDGVRSGTVVAISFAKRLVLIGGTEYAGEIKKSIFTVLNYLLPKQGVLSMHCSANVGVEDDVALFFGLSGTGKTTLSSDSDRKLIGDDEHGWSVDGVFNFEGGCYAKTIRLRPELEPIIWSATHQFGAVLENVILDPESRKPLFDDDRLTENTRGAYPIDFVPNRVESGYAGHPEHIFFLTADAFGVMPPIARLTAEQAMYYFLSGYTSKLAGTEKDLSREPEATFSTCFGSPFLPLHPHVYADLLGEKIARHQATVWLVNTGWTGGPYGIGSRIKLAYTRAMIKAALNHDLDQVLFHRDPFFGLYIPEQVPGVPADVLEPQRTWSNPQAYAAQAQNLIMRFEKNFKQFQELVSNEVVSAGPQNH